MNGTFWHGDEESKDWSTLENQDVRVADEQEDLQDGTHRIQRGYSLSNVQGG